MSYRVTEIWAFTSIDNDDEEGVVAFHSGVGWMPMLAADETRLRQLTPMAQAVCDDTQRPVHLRKFSSMEEVLVLSPKERQ